jgi:hypothetical protein
MGWRFAKTLREEVLPEEQAEDADLWDPKIEREMNARIYVLPQLIPILERAKVRWRYINYGYQFKFRGNYILSWWPRTGALQWQGHAKGEDHFLPQEPTVVERVEAFIAIPYAGDLYPDEFPERKKPMKRRKLSKGEMLKRLEETKRAKQALEASDSSLPAKQR